MNQKSLFNLFVQAALVSVAVLLTVAVFGRWLPSLPLSISQITTQKEAAFQASGESIISTVPDRVDITLGISLRDDQITAAQQRANNTINAITEKILALGVDKNDIKTENYSIYPNYDYQNPSQNIVGYSVQINMLVSLKDFNLLNQVTDLATANGANQISGINFTLSDEKEREIRAEARQQALDDAKNNAQELARMAGMKLGKIVNVIESPTSQYQDLIKYQPMSAAGGLGGGAPTNIQPGSTDYHYQVTVSYETL